MAFNRLEVNDLATAALDDSDQIIVGESNKYKKATVSALKNNILGSSPSYTTDTEPYLMRRTKHVGVVGKCALEKLVGGSLGWNQLVKELNSTNWTNENGTTASFVDGVATFTSTINNNGIVIQYSLSTFVNHKYLLCMNVKSSTAYTGLSFGIPGSGQPIIRFTDSIGGDTAWHTIEGIRECTSSDNLKRIYIFRTNGTVENLSVRNVMILDLTATFGSTIADYIYSLEQATAGAGIAKLKEWGFDLDTYHAYDAGSIQSVQATAHVTKDADDNVIGNYPLGSDTLRGVPQLISNKLSYDGDEKYPDGTIRRKYGIVDLGSLTYTGDSGGFVLSTSIGAKVQSTQAVMAKIICSKYPTIMQSQLSGSDKCVYGLNWGNGIGFRDSAYNTPAAFKTAMSGVYLVYELETETTESSTAYQKVQTIDADGTESFTTSSPVPVGHETQTPDNILAALSWVGE